MILKQLQENKTQGRKALAVLVDPDKIKQIGDLIRFVQRCVENCVDYLFVGGSLMVNDGFSKVISILKSNCDIPVIIFPGHNMQIDANADAILLLSLISGRNPEFLIGQHVHAAPILKKSKIEIIPVGYMLVNSGIATSASYMSNTTPIPADKSTIAACTAMAGEMLGLRSLYVDAGSGAEKPVPQKIISSIVRSTDIPLIIGGGLNSKARIGLAFEAGADMVVIGTAIEKEAAFLEQAAEQVQALNAALDVN